jgi:hypothetical protein
LQKAEHHRNVQKQVTDGKNGGGNAALSPRAVLWPFCIWGNANVPGAASLTAGASNTRGGLNWYVPAIRHPPSAIRHPPTANCQLPTANCQLPSANCHLPSAICQLGSGTPCSAGGASIQKNLIDHGLGWFAGTDTQRWSSTQARLTEGWAHTRTEGSVSATGKSTGLPVRCVASVTGSAAQLLEPRVNRGARIPFRS